MVKSRRLAGYDHRTCRAGTATLCRSTGGGKEFRTVGDKLDAGCVPAKVPRVRSEQIEGQSRDFPRLGVIGDWNNPSAPWISRSRRTCFDRWRRSCSAATRPRRQPVPGASMRLGACRGGDRVRGQDIAAVDVAYDAVGWRAAGAQVRRGQRRCIVNVPIWTTTPWTLPASMAVRLGPDLEYVLVEGPPRAGHRVLLVLAQALAASAMQRYAMDEPVVLGRALGATLEMTTLQHPFYSRRVPLILGDHVTTEAGTGAVHTAPGHGQEDFVVGLKYGLEVLNPIDGRGIFLPATEIFADSTSGRQTTALPPARRARRLLASEKLAHSYPHCWRHKTPVAFRATPQWFISMDQAHLRRDALEAIKGVKWIPDWGEARITGMIEGRPDWCISRQRTWGVPIALFVHRETGEPHPRSVELMQEVATRVERIGTDAWFTWMPANLLGPKRRTTTRSTTPGFWFDSGVTHERCLPRAKRRDCTSPPTLPEGSDQHRGWFQSSLLTVRHGRRRALPPGADAWLHGDGCDGKCPIGRQRRRPQKVIDAMGADVLRL